MTWNQLVQQFSNATASSLQVADVDLVASFCVLGLIVGALLAHALAFTDTESPRYERVNAAGRGLLMSLKFMRAGYWAILPIGKELTRRRVSPNCITFVGFLLSCAAAASILYGRLGLAGIALLAGALCDVLDGMVARLGNSSSESGAVLDAIVDRSGEIVVFMALAAAAKRSTFMAATCQIGLLASLMNSYVSAKAEVYRVSIPSGRMRRGERSAWIILGCSLVPLAQALVPLSRVTQTAVPLVVCVGAVALGTTVSMVARARALYVALSERAERAIKCASGGPATASGQVVAQLSSQDASVALASLVPSNASPGVEFFTVAALGPREQR